MYEQTKQHDDPHGEFFLFYHVTRGNYERLVKIILDRKDDVSLSDLIDKRDAVGGNIIHVAYLYEQWKIARFLVENFPAVAAKPYQKGNWDDRSPDKGARDSGPYNGENILHIALIHRNYGEVRWLLEFYFLHDGDRKKVILKKLLTQRADGVFFHKKGRFYFGGRVQPNNHQSLYIQPSLKHPIPKLTHLFVQHSVLL